MLIFGLLAAALFVASGGVAHGGVHRDAGSTLTDWRQITPPGKQSAAFTVGPTNLIEVRADDAVSFLYAELTAPSPDLRLSWRWRVDSAPAPTELAMRGMDDRPLAVHLWFPPPPGGESFWDGVKGALGYPTFGYAMTYVWGGTSERGEIIANPHLDDAALIVLRDGEAPRRTWFQEHVNVAADFERVFGHAPLSAPVYIAISTDTDDKGGTAIGRIADLRFGS